METPPQQRLEGTNIVHARMVPPPQTDFSPLENSRQPQAGLGNWFVNILPFFSPQDKMLLLNKALNFARGWSRKYTMHLLKWCSSRKGVAVVFPV